MTRKKDGIQTMPSFFFISLPRRRDALYHPPVCSAKRTPSQSKSRSA